MDSNLPFRRPTRSWSYLEDERNGNPAIPTAGDERDGPREIARSRGHREQSTAGHGANQGITRRRSENERQAAPDTVQSPPFTSVNKILYALIICIIVFVFWGRPRTDAPISLIDLVLDGDFTSYENDTRSIFTTSMTPDWYEREPSSHLLGYIASNGTQCHRHINTFSTMLMLKVVPGFKEACQLGSCHGLVRALSIAREHALPVKRSFKDVLTSTINFLQHQKNERIGLNDSLAQANADYRRMAQATDLDLSDRVWQDHVRAVRQTAPPAIKYLDGVVDDLEKGIKRLRDLADRWQLFVLTMDDMLVDMAYTISQTISTAPAASLLLSTDLGYLTMHHKSISVSAEAPLETSQLMSETTPPRQSGISCHWPKAANFEQTFFKALTHLCGDDGDCLRALATIFYD